MMNFFCNFIYVFHFFLCQKYEEIIKKIGEKKEKREICWKFLISFFNFFLSIIISVEQKQPYRLQWFQLIDLSVYFVWLHDPNTPRIDLLMLAGFFLMASFDKNN